MASLSGSTPSSPVIGIARPLLSNSLPSPRVILSISLTPLFSLLPEHPTQSGPYPVIVPVNLTLLLILFFNSSKELTVTVSIKLFL